MILQTAYSSIQQPLTDGNAPPWASGWGQDRYGIFIEFSLAAAEDKIVTQRLRWIPPGTFTMGSPEDEPDRRNDEGPQHKVTLTAGFWLFDTPCTQALWNVVMEENPSRFVDDERPVESVTWHECQDFMQRLSEDVEGLYLTIPTEAQWEYACRAGTTTATYAGEIEILGENNAPVLDEIAWYGGNSGVDFDLENGFDSSDWPNKQHDHKFAGTRQVAQKQPNAWGLYDMLGNVWEWCLDGQRTYRAGSAIDPHGSLEPGADRVVRGGSWDDFALLARSAYRLADHPGGRDDDLGFRCALVRQPS
jgi:formylglycine-generating enzyme required for sulfatase activity